MNKQKLMSALQAELNRQFEYGAIMFYPDYMGSGQPMITYPIGGHPAPRPVIDLERLADAGLYALALAHATTKTACAHEYGKSNGDGTFSVVIDRGEPKRPVSDWPITPLYLAPAQAVPGDMVLVRGAALVLQLRAVMHRLDGQAYSSTLSALNYFEAALAGQVSLPASNEPQPLAGSDSLQRQRDEALAALTAIYQRGNESGTGEMGLIDTIHDMCGIARDAISKAEGWS